MTSYMLLQFEIVLIILTGIIIFIQGLFAKQPELILLALPNLIAIIYLVTNNDWLITITAWELFNLSLYLLVGLSPFKPSLSASYKYFLLNALVTMFMLLTVTQIYSLTGSTNYDNTNLALLMHESNNLYLILIVTLLWKLGATTVHSWATDLYDSLSLTLVLWMIIIPK